MKLYKIMMLVFVAVLSVSANENNTARDIMDKSYKMMKIDGTEAVSTLTIIDAKGRERVRKTSQVTKLYNNGKTEKKLIKFLSPADVKGTGLLTFDYDEKDDDMWLFMPALRKTRRIVSTEKSKSFMGSEFSYAEMTPPSLDDFTYKQLADKDVDGTPCWQIELVPKDEDIADENGFSRRVVLVAKNDYVARRAFLYDFDDELFKELSVLKVQEVDIKNHKFRPVHLKMENIQNGRKSVLKIEKIVYSPNVKDEYFTTRFLERQ
jgi:hypothetical protein